MPIAANATISNATSPNVASAATRPYTRIDWKRAAKLLAGGRSAEAAAAAIGIDEDRLWRHWKRSLRFRHLVQQAMARRRELAMMQVQVAAPTAALNRCLESSSLVADAEMLALLSGGALQAASPLEAASLSERVAGLGEIAASPPPNAALRARLKREQAELNAAFDRETVAWAELAVRRAGQAAAAELAADKAARQAKEQQIKQQQIKQQQIAAPQAKQPPASQDETPQQPKAAPAAVTDAARDQTVANEPKRAETVTNEPKRTETVTNGPERTRTGRDDAPQPPLSPAALPSIPAPASNGEVDPAAIQRQIARDTQPWPDYDDEYGPAVHRPSRFRTIIDLPPSEDAASPPHGP